ncbi:hypothetical protein BGW38_010777 [Lunasporangiospora selenospora]|uniref:SPIN90/Ldb17 leucine-rich domain-containing protein n=1 Tax=Lunasporangiospora selenospora TaxID=979761 RepID=A0A9P6G2N7_9FUNG|nr:hypothetical protein BGW38_010777 [Lunasporangiospora selenospora]
MSFFTYQFESSSQFYTELQDLLDGAGFHESPETQVDSYISLIAQYQDEFLDAAGQDLAHCCYRLFDSALFQNNALGISSLVIDRAIQSQDEKDLWITYHILFYAGQENTKVYHWMLKSEFIAKLKYQILQLEGSRLHLVAVSLMFEVCRVQSLKPTDLALADESFLNYLLDLVERTKTDADEMLNSGSIKLLLTFNEQYMLNMSNPQYIHNSNPFGNPLLSVLAERPGTNCTFGESLVFMLNQETALQMLILKLLYLLFTTQRLMEFFYTNDLHVLVDVVIRELMDLSEEEESLRQGYLRVLGPLLLNTQMRNSSYKRSEIIKTLSSLGGGSLDEKLRNQLEEEFQREQDLERQRRAVVVGSRKVTYRDRESSSSPFMAAATIMSAKLPTTAEAETESASAGSSVKRPASASSGMSSCSVNTMITNPSTGGSACPSPVLSSGPTNDQAGNLVHKLESLGLKDECGALPLMSRQDSSSSSHFKSLKPVSPTTLRLVERVLRDWLENEAHKRDQALLMQQRRGSGSLPPTPPTSYHNRQHIVAPTAAA